MASCPYCNHCKALERMRQEEERMERQRQELLAEEKKKAALKQERDEREGKIYGTDYFMYREEDIKNITDCSFLHDLWAASIPSAQPPSDEEYQELMHFLNVIQSRISELQK